MSDTKKIIIAVDGFSSCGKSTFAKAIAARLGYIFIDTGALGVHPAFFYESMWNLLGFIVLVLLAKRGRKFNGQMFLSYVIWYGLGRAVIEGMRTDSLYFFGTGIRSSQMLGIVSAAVGIGLYVLRLKTAGPASPPFVKAEEISQPAEEPVPAAEIPVEPEETVPAEEPAMPEPEESVPVAEPAVPEPEEPVPVAASAEPAAPEENSEEEKQDGGDTD